MFYYLLIPILFVAYIINIFFRLISFIIRVFKNIFQKKIKKNIDEIIAIGYYSEEWPDLVAFTLYYDENKVPKYLNQLKPEGKISKIKFDRIKQVIDENNILNKKTYFLSNPLISFKEYFSYFTCSDTGPTRQSLTIYFKDGGVKYLEGYSKSMEILRKVFTEVLPNEMFY